MKYCLILLLFELCSTVWVFSQDTLREFTIEKDDRENDETIVFYPNCSPGDGVIVFYTTIPDLKFNLPNTPSRLKNVSAFDRLRNRYVLCLQPTDTTIGGFTKYSIEITGTGYKPEPAYQVSGIKPGLAQYFKINPKNPPKAEEDSDGWGPMTWYKEGEKNSDAGNYSEAISCYRKALEMNPDMSDAWYNLGIAYERENKLADAIDCYMRASQLGNKDAQERLRLINLKNDAAIVPFEQKPAVPDYSPMALYQEGLKNSDAGNYSKAIECYRKALDMNPDMDEAWYKLGIAYGREKKYNDASNCYQKASQLGNKEAQKLLRLTGKK